MSRKPVPAQSGDRSRTEVVFDRPQLMAQLFGEFDQNLLALENKLGVYITARGNRSASRGRRNRSRRRATCCTGCTTGSRAARSSTPG